VARRNLFKFWGWSENREPAMAGQRLDLGRLPIEGYMTANSREKDEGAPRYRYLLLAALIFILASALMAALWQMPRLFPGLFPLWATSLITETPTALPATATPTPSVLQLTITDLNAEVDDKAQTITFSLAAEIPSDRDIVEALLWYDTETGHQVQRMAGPWSHATSLSYRLDAAHEGLTRTLTTTQELDYWWLVRDTAGEAVREGGSVTLSPNLWSQVSTPTPEPPPIDFTWSVSETQHFAFYFVPGTAAERDRFQVGAMAETSLSEIESVLDVELDSQMSIYLVPRVFWQGGATYADKVQLISYLDRNYTDVETWSYFTHEGTHALAQDLLQPKEDGGGPDGVLVEGLAVWASDGHYRREPIDAWAAIVAASDKYIPLADLRAGPFYDFQHETSYLEAASFVKFLVDRYGLDKFKELYGQATGNAEHDEALVQSLYGKGYDDLEADWLGHLASLNPTTEQAEAWGLRVRFFDLMRRYETELDPDARLLPSDAPPEWTSDTLKVFLDNADGQANVVLETAFIAAQERLDRGDSEGAADLLDDVEAALDTGSVETRPSLEARQAILDLVAAQDRAILRADAKAYRDTLDPASRLAQDAAMEAKLEPPYTTYQQEMVRLDVSDDGLSAQGVILAHAEVFGSESPEDEQLYAVTFALLDGHWLLSSRVPATTDLSVPPPARN
jgi:hypothetical protein